MPDSDLRNDILDSLQRAESSKGRSITKRLTIGLVITVLFVSAIAISLSYFVASQRAKAQLEDRATEYITSLTDILKIPLWDVAEETDDYHQKQEQRTGQPARPTTIDHKDSYTAY